MGAFVERYFARTPSGAVTFAPPWPACVGRAMKTTSTTPIANAVTGSSKACDIAVENAACAVGDREPPAAPADVLAPSKPLAARREVMMAATAALPSAPAIWRVVL